MKRKWETVELLFAVWNGDADFAQTVMVTAANGWNDSRVSVSLLRPDAVNLLLSDARQCRAVQEKRHLQALRQTIRHQMMTDQLHHPHQNFFQYRGRLLAFHPIRLPITAVLSVVAIDAVVGSMTCIICDYRPL